MLEDGQRIGAYRVVRKLGEGGMGAVYEAVHDSIERRVAIKVLHPRFSRESHIATRFLNEARAVNIVDHPGVVSVSDFGSLPDGTAFIVMEYLKGESLRARMQRAQGTVLPEALRLARQIASALAAAHDRGIVHRDLKPDNVMLVPDPEAPGGERAKILDFGIAKVAEAHQQKDGAQVHTESGTILGTPTYMAPEQCRGAGSVTDRADVYSLGVILYQMLGGRPPFVAQGSGEVLAMHLYKEPAPLMDLLPTVAPELASLVHAMLRKEPQERPAMTQVVVMLGQLGGGSATLPPGDPGADLSMGRTLDATADPLAATHPGTSTLQKAAGQKKTEAPLPVRRSKLLLVAGLLAVVTVGGGGGLLYYRGRGAVEKTLVLPQVGMKALHDFHDASGAARTLLKDADGWESAAADFGRALGQPGAPLRWRSGRAFCQGRARLLHGDATGGGQSFREAIQLEEGWAAAHVGLSDALEHAGDRTGALLEAHRAQELEPGWWLPLAEVAGIYANDNQMDQAIQTYRRALSVAPDEPSLLDGLALALHAARLDSEADAVSEKALQRDPDLLWSRLLRAERALEREDGQTALSEASRAAGVSPSTAAVQLARADALALLHRKEEALLVYRHFLELLKTNGHLGLPESRVAQVEKAVAAGELPPPRTTGADEERTRGAKHLSERTRNLPSRTRAPAKMAPQRTRGDSDILAPAF